MEQHRIIEGDGNFRELDYDYDGHREVWLMWEQNLNIVALVVARVLRETVYLENGGEYETSEEVIEAAVVPNPEAWEARIHPSVYIDRYKLD